MANYLRNIGVSDEKIVVMPNGINEERFCAPTTKPPQLPDLSHKTVIGFVGFARPWHGLDRVLNVMHQMNDNTLFLLIIGDGPAVKTLQTRAAELGLSEQIFISGIVQRNEMPNWVAQIQIALQPDVVAYASPLKMLEYLALGKAIIAPDTANIRELLCHNQNALLFNPEQTPSFNECLLAMLSSNSMRKQLGEQAAKTIRDKNLTWKDNAQRIVVLFQQLLSKENS